MPVKDPQPVCCIPEEGAKKHEKAARKGAAVLTIIEWSVFAIVLGVRDVNVVPDAFRRHAMPSHF